MSDSVRPHRWQPTRLPRAWDSPGKNTGVGCHFLLQCMKVKSESEVAQSCLTLRDPMDCSLPGSYIHGIFQARVLEWVAIAFSVSSHRDTQTHTQTYATAPAQRIGYDSAHAHTPIRHCSGAKSRTRLSSHAAAAAAKSLQSCPTLCDPIDGSPPGSSVPGILQARTLEWVAISFSNAWK